MFVERGSGRESRSAFFAVVIATLIVTVKGSAIRWQCPACGRELPTKSFPAGVMTEHVPDINTTHCPHCGTGICEDLLP